MLWPCASGERRPLGGRLAMLGEQPALQTALEELGQPCITVADDAPLPDDIAGVLLVASAATDANRRAFTRVQEAAPFLRARLNDGQPAFLGALVALDGGLGFASGPLSIAGSAGLAGLVKTAAREWLGLRARVIDPGSAAPELIAEHLLREGPVELALGGGQPRTVRLQAEAASPARLTPIHPGDGIIVTGGARGVTADVAVALAARFGCRFLLLGRSPVPGHLPEWLAERTAEADEAMIKRGVVEQEGIRKPKEIQARTRELVSAVAIHETCLAIHRAGGRARYARADGRKATAVMTAAAAFRSDGPIAGLVHGAGVLADRYIVDQTAEQWDLVYGTKVEGLDNLLAACAYDELRLLIGFSSSTARFGRTGQVAYAMGNEVLAKRLRDEAARRGTCRCIAADWGPWDGGMVTPELKTVFAAEGIQVIPRQAGAAWCAEAAGRPPASAVETVILGSGSQLPTEDLGPETRIACDNLPLLRDHVIEGKAVLPAAWAAELLIAATGCGQGAGLRIADMDVLAGLRLGEHDSATIDIQRADGLVTLLSGGRPAYRARCELREPLSAIASLEPQGLEALPAGWYDDGRLFHGPALQFLSAAACGEQAVVCDAALKGLGRPAGLDALFQALILWSWQRHGAPCLPLGWEAVDCCADDWPDDVQVRAVIVGETGNNLVANAEITVGDMLLLRISGARATISKNLAAAFKDTRLR